MVQLKFNFNSTKVISAIPGLIQPNNTWMEHGRVLLISQDSGGDDVEVTHIRIPDPQTGSM